MPHFYSLNNPSFRRQVVFYLLSLSLSLLNTKVQAQVPTITNFTPLSGKPGDVVTITGIGFNTTTTNNIVYFGATKATVTSATTTSLTVTVPVGATHGPIKLINSGVELAAYSMANFNPIYSPSKTGITTNDFAARQDIAADTGPNQVVSGDLDGDGLVDLVVLNTSTNSFSVFRNTSAYGSLTTNSFEAKVDFTTGTTPRAVALGDLDLDGKLDIAVTNEAINTVSIFRNTSTSGSITTSSFAAAVDFSTGTSPRFVTIGDLDLDGKPELLVTNYAASTASVFRNISTPGAITTGSFSTKVDFGVGGNPSSAEIGDIDGDNFPDLVVTNFGATAGTSGISLLRNISTNGTFNFSARQIFTSGAGPTSAVLSDLDGDNKLDVLVANNGSSASVGVYRNTATLGILDPNSLAARVEFFPGFNVSSVAIGDIDGDAKPEFIATSASSNRVTVFRNVSTAGTLVFGSFASGVNLTTGTSPQSVTIADLDGDSKLDLTVANASSSSISIFRNTDLAPIIASFSPLSAKPGDVVTITGSGFHPTGTNNMVFFGATKATVTSASATSVTVTVPNGATYAPITVLNTVSQLAAYSLANFNPIYAPAKTGITATDFLPKQDFFTGAEPSSIAIGDLDGDGKPDLAVANQTDNTISVYRNTSTSGSINSGSFASKVDFTTGFLPNSVAIGDLDGDGKPDLVATNEFSNSVSVLRNTSTSGIIDASSFANTVDFSTTALPSFVVINDLDGDGKPDLVVSSNNSNYFSILRNTSTSGSITAGSFAANVDFVTNSVPKSVAVADLDGDGKADVAVANGNSTVSVFRNTSTMGSITAGSFATGVDFTTGSTPSSVAIGDLDGDGKSDLVVTNQSSNSVSVLRNTSVSGSINTSSFATKVDFATGSLSVSVAIGDLDGDGKPDLAVANSGNFSNNISILRNTSTSGIINTSSFAAKVDFATDESPYSVAIGDLDGDGKPDLAVTNYSIGSLSILRNADIPAPTITSFTPLSAKPGDAVTITGTGFSATNTNNMVFFGATKATVTSASATSLTVTVPTGATYAPITVLNSASQLAAYSIANFNPIYAPAKTGITATDYQTKQDFTTGTQPYTVAIGDLDGDGKSDLVVANFNSGNISIYRNISTTGVINSGSFAPRVDFAVGTRATSATIGDLNNDGKPDLVVTNSFSNIVSVFQNTSTSGTLDAGSFAARVDFTTGASPFTSAIADLDGDGKSDIAVINQSSRTVSIFRNTGLSQTITSASFAPKVDFATATNPFSVAIGDLDGDNKPELAVANAASISVSIFKNTSTMGSITAGSFAPKVDFATLNSPYFVAIGDLDGDGKPDLAVANGGASRASVLRNTTTTGIIASNSFATKVDFIAGSMPAALAIADLDGDGKPDLAVPNTNSSNISILRNTSVSGSITTSSFATKVDYIAGGNPFSVAVGDLDGDHRPELVVANGASNNISIFRNTSNNADLSALALSSGTLTPAFAANTLSYTASVTNPTTSITITPTLADANASVTANGVAVTSGNASGDIALNVGNNTITVVVTAENGTTKTYTVVVTRINNPPTIANPIPNQNATEDAAFNFQFALNTFADVDAGTTLTYTAQLNGGGALPAWLSFNGATRTFSGTPLNANVGTLSVDVIANDGNGGTVTDNFTITVANVNDAPTVANPIPNQNATEDLAFSYQFPANTFADVDAGTTLTYTAQLNGGGTLPTWLSFNGATRTFSGTPLNANVGAISIDVIADDSNGGTVADNFTITVANVNDNPTIANAIPNQNATENVAFNFQFALNTFADVDAGTTLTYSAQLNGGGALPTWLSFNGTTRVFSGTPTNVDVGTISIDVIANDGNGATVTENFDITVFAVLPVALNEFAAKAQTDRTVLLTWNTFSEQNNDYFEIARSINGQNFEVLTTIKGKVTSAQPSFYNYLDRAPKSGVNYYKLTQVDLDGARKELGIISVNVTLSNEISIAIYPNPSADVVNVSFEAGKFTSLALIDMNGKLILKKEIKVQATETYLDLRDLAPANYLIQLNGHRSTATKIIVKK